MPPKKEKKKELIKDQCNICNIEMEQLIREKERFELKIQEMDDKIKKKQEEIDNWNSLDDDAT